MPSIGRPKEGGTGNVGLPSDVRKAPFYRPKEVSMSAFTIRKVHKTEEKRKPLALAIFRPYIYIKENLIDKTIEEYFRKYIFLSLNKFGQKITFFLLKNQLEIETLDTAYCT